MIYYEGISTAGHNLWDAIMHTSYGGSDPPLVQEWIEEQTKSYLDKDWDHDYIRQYMEQLKNSELDIFFNCLIEHEIDIDDAFLGGIDRDTLKKWSEEYDKEKKQVCEKLLTILLEDLENDHLPNSRYYSAYEKASEDFDLFTEDIDTENDQDVRDFFCIDAKIRAYDIDGKEYSLEEVYICPYCDEPNPIDEQQDQFEINREYDDIKYDSSLFNCKECMAECNINDQAFLDENKHIPEEEIIARCV